MTIFDITVAISPSLPVFPGDPPVLIEPVASIAKGDPANVSRISFSSHCGSHVDSPLHFQGGGIPVDRLPLSLLIGRALVADLRGTREIGRQALARLPLSGVERLLLHTDNSLLWHEPGFNEHYAHLTAEGAAYLREKKVALVGIDYLSIERFDGNGDVHRLLLGSGIVVLEGLDLDGIGAGEYELICLPLKLAGGDGAPVRAVLRGGPRAAGDAPFDPHTSKWPLA